MNKLSVILVDDHSLIRLGLKNLLSTDEKLIVVNEFDNGREALDYIQSRQPDIAILDIEMPGLNGLEVCKNIRMEGIPTKVIFLTMLNEKAIYEKAHLIGANAFILKDFILEEIHNAIDTVIKNEFYISPSLIGKLSDKPNKLLHNEEIKALISLLTSTERQILKLIAQNFNSKQIAEKLFSSEHTIKTHRKNITRKLDLDIEQGSLTKFAIQNIEYLRG